MFQWKSDYSIGIKSVDEQHKRLFALGNFLYDIISKTDGKDRHEEISEVLNDLVDYANYHFSHEEDVMAANDYPDFNNHKREHDSFLNRISPMIEDLVKATVNEVHIIENKDIEEKADEKRKRIGIDLVVFISKWIENHILRTDMKYKEFLSERGVS